MAQTVTFNARLKRVQSTGQIDKEDGINLVTGIALEGDDVAAEDVQRLVHMQREELEITIEPKQGGLFVVPAPAGEDAE